VAALERAVKLKMILGLPLLSSFASDAPNKLNILIQNSYAIGMNGAKIGVFEQSHQVSLTGCP
jgi:hypothetical protein